MSSRSKAGASTVSGISPAELADPEIFAGGFDAGAKSALIKVGEAGAADQFAFAVGADAIEQARIRCAAERFDIVDALEVAILRHVEQLLIELLVGQAFFGGDFQHADRRASRSGDGGAAMPVGLGKVAHRLASDEIVLKFSIGDEIDGLRGDAFVVDVVGADEAFAVEGLERRIVGDIEEFGQHARVKARREGAVGAGFGAEAGARGDDACAEQRAQRVGAGIGAEQDGTVVLLFDERAPGGDRRGMR